MVCDLYTSFVMNVVNKGIELNNLHQIGVVYRGIKVTDLIDIYIKRLLLRCIHHFISDLI